MEVRWASQFGTRSLVLCFIYIICIPPFVLFFVFCVVFFLFFRLFVGLLRYLALTLAYLLLFVIQEGLTVTIPTIEISKCTEHFNTLRATPVPVLASARRR